MPGPRKPPEPTGSLAALLEQAGAQTSDPQVDETVSHFFHLVGGAKGLARILFDEFHASKPGSLMRQRILDMVLKSTKFVNERDGGNSRDLGMLSEEDLARELATQMAQLRSGREQA